MKPTFFAKAKGKSGEIYIYSEIGEGWFSGITAQSFNDALKEVGNIDVLDIYMNSPGGNVFDGVAIYNQLKRFKAKKIVHVDALAASIASVICMAGDEIVMAPNAMMMIHDPWGMAIGTAADMRKIADSLEQVKDILLDTYVTRTKGDRTQIDKWMQAETWMKADEAKARGFADTINQDEGSEEVEEAKNIAFPILAKFKNTPERLTRSSRASNALLARMNQDILKIRRASPVSA